MSNQENPEKQQFQDDWRNQENSQYQYKFQNQHQGQMQMQMEQDFNVKDWLRTGTKSNLQKLKEAIMASEDLANNPLS